MKFSSRKAKKELEEMRRVEEKMQGTPFEDIIKKKHEKYLETMKEVEPKRLKDEKKEDIADLFSKICSEQKDSFEIFFDVDIEKISIERRVFNLKSRNSPYRQGFLELSWASHDERFHIDLVFDRQTHNNILFSYEVDSNVLVINDSDEKNREKVINAFKRLFKIAYNAEEHLGIDLDDD